MAQVKFTYALKRFFPDLKEEQIPSSSVAEVMQKLEAIHPGINSYILNDQGALRRHVNIFVDGDLILDRDQLSDAISENSEVYIMQALSGG